MRDKYVKQLLKIMLTLLLIGGVMNLSNTEIYADELLMTEPILQNPDESSVIVQWFTEGECENNRVLVYGNGTTRRPTQIIQAETTKLSRVRGGKTDGDCNNASITQDIYKHVAKVDGLPRNTGKETDRIPYMVKSGTRKSGIYTLAANPTKGTDVKILLTSDLQSKDMCAANIEKVYETVGRVDAVWLDGDIVDVTDRAYDWFYADNAFFRVMTGTADDKVGGKTYQGAPLLQYAPIYTSIGNHDVMGVYSETGDLSVQFNSPIPRDVARKRLKAKGIEDAQSIADASYNTITYEEMFELPTSKDGGEKWYAKSIGDIRLVSLEAARVWKLPNLGMIGKFTEWPGATEEMRGYGDFIFESLAADSDQIRFLKSELNSDEYQDAKFKVVMFHEETHSLGGNKIPPFTDPVEGKVTDPVTGLQMITYDYPKDKDYLETVVEPLVEKAGTNLIFNAHSHLWNRFQTKSGMNILETSNVGNNYGAYYDGKKRDQYPSALKSGDTYSGIANAWNKSNYITSGDPNGLEPVEPNKADLPGGKSYLASNTVTAFSILDTKKGTVDSYYFDTAKPDSQVVLFDSFKVVK